MALTFDECATKFVKAHAPGWSNPKHAQQWTNTLKTYASPVLGELLVRDVELLHVPGRQRRSRYVCTPGARS